MTKPETPLRTYLVVFFALLVLLWATYEVSRHNFGDWNFAVAMTIASTKAVLIALFFMKLRQSYSVTQLIAVAGLLWLVIMFVFTLADYYTRTGGMSS